MYCPGCGKTNESDKKFCIYCGTPLSPPAPQTNTPPPTSLEIACPQCNQLLLIPQELLGQAVKCPYCNSAFQTKQPPMLETIPPGHQDNKTSSTYNTPESSSKKESQSILYRIVATIAIIGTVGILSLCLWSSGWFQKEEDSSQKKVTHQENNKTKKQQENRREIVEKYPYSAIFSCRGAFGKTPLPLATATSREGIKVRTEEGVKLYYITDFGSEYEFKVPLTEHFEIEVVNENTGSGIELHLKITDSKGKVLREEVATPYNWIIVSN